jgi:hypothetical protein
MAPATDELAVAWNSLTVGDGERDGWRSIPVALSGSVPLHAARRFPGGAEAILVRFSSLVLSPAMKLPEGTGFRVERVSTDDGVAWLALTRRDGASVELFTAMARDVAGALGSCPAGNEEKAFAILIGRVRAWQEFMRKGAEPLGPEAEIGLFGELVILRGVLDAGVVAAPACEAWRGPLGGLRDFELGTGGLEVKSTLSALGFPARVGSLEQLDDTERQPLFLAAVRLRQTVRGRSLPDAIEGVRDVVAGDGEAERLLADRLLASGYCDAHVDTYLRKFEVAETRVLRVAEGFPRLTPYSVPSGVLRAAYEVDLDKATSEITDVASALRELKVI